MAKRRPRWQREQDTAPVRVCRSTNYDKCKEFTTLKEADAAIRSRVWGDASVDVEKWDNPTARYWLRYMARILPNGKLRKLHP